jgi:hypothetical protein
MSNYLLLMLMSRLSSGTRKISKMSSSSLPRPHPVRIQRRLLREAELDEAWDLNTKDDSPAGCLSELEEENYGSE